MKRLLVWSNLSWLLPFAIAVTHYEVLWALMAGLMGFMSAIFHATERPWLRNLDTLFAVLFLVCGPYLLISNQVGVAEWGIGVFVFVCALLVYFQSRKEWLKTSRVYTRKYIFWHTIWHLTSALLAMTIYLLAFTFSAVL